MRELSKGRYEVCINGTTKEILVSFGVKKELYKIISRGQVAAANLNPQVYMSEANRANILSINNELDRLKQAETYEGQEAEITAKDVELEEAYRVALIDLELRQREAVFGLAIKHIDLTSDVMAEGLACLLAERDSKGLIITPITPADILWGDEYVDAAEELLELLTAVVDYITSALKKISNLNQMISEAGNQKEKLQA